MKLTKMFPNWVRSLKKDISKEPWWRDGIEDDEDDWVNEPLKHPWQVMRERFVGNAEEADPDYVSELLSRVGSGEPGLSTQEEPFLHGRYSTLTHIVYRDPKGKPVMAATLDSDGQVVEMGLDKNRGLLGGKAANAIFTELKVRGIKHPEQKILTSWFGQPSSSDARRLIHKYSVQQALKEGKPVPPEVLADYPESWIRSKSPFRKLTPDLLDRYEEAFRPSAAAPSPKTTTPKTTSKKTTTPKTASKKTTTPKTTSQKTTTPKTTTSKTTTPKTTSQKTTSQKTTTSKTTTPKTTTSKTTTPKTTKKR